MINTAKSLLSFITPISNYSVFTFPEELQNIPIKDEEKPNLLESSIKKLNLERFKIRSLKEMFQKDGFHYPNISISEQININLTYYGPNYIIFLFLLFCYVCISIPLFLFTVAAIIAINFTYGYNSHIVAISCLGLILAGGTTLFTVTVLSLIFVSIHAIMRSNSVDKEKTN